MTAVQESVGIMDSFIAAITDADYANFTANTDQLPPKIVYSNGSKYFAWDVCSNKFYIDSNFVLAVPYDFSKTAEIKSKVDAVCASANEVCLESSAYSWNQTMGA